MFRFEMHLHTAACSACASATSVEMVRAAKEHGYAGIVLTNHFLRGNTCVDRHLPWEEFVGEYRRDWLRSKAEGERLGVTVLFGIEEVYEPGKEVLIYGITPEQLIAVPQWKKWGIKQISKYVRACGGFLVCAHPFRARAYIPNPDAEPDVRQFDALEINNHFNLPEENEKAEALANRTGMPGTSGSDVHHAADFGHAGLAFLEPVTDNASLLKALREGRYRLIINDEFVE